MKKLLSTILMASLFMFMAIPVFSAPAGAPEHEGNTIFAADNIVEEIKANLDEQQVRKFFNGKDVLLDFEHVIPVYMTLNIEKSTTLFESLEFISEYNVPVTDVQENSMGLATLQLYNGKWVIGIFIEDYDVMEMMNNQSAMQDGSVYFVEFNTNGEFGLLNVSKSGETYVKLEKGIRSTHSIQNGSDVLSQLKDDLAKNDGDSEGAGPASTPSVIPYDCRLNCHSSGYWLHGLYY
jgi:hypothetical protein